MGIGPVDVDLLEHVELDAKAGGKLFDLGVGARLLEPELVTGEGEDGQLTLCLENCICLMRSRWRLVCGVPYLVVFFVQLYQLRVVDLCLSSFGGNIDDHTDLARVLTEVNLK